MKVYVSVLFIVYAVNPLMAQIIGKVKDTGGQPVPYANILLLTSSDSAMVTGAVSQEDGSFELSKPNQGSYTIQYSAIGYHTVTAADIDVRDISSLTDVGIVVLVPDAVELNEVTVKATRPLFEQNPSG